MKFFLGIAIAVLLLLIILVLLLVFSLKKFSAKKAKYRWQFFIPTILTVAIVLYVIFIVVPIGFDAVDIVARRSDITTIKVEELKAPAKLISAGGVSYKYSFFEEDIEEGKEYQVKLTGRTNYAYDFKKLDSNSESSGRK